MADPEKKEITAPAGTMFQLRWTLPYMAKTTISFVDKDGSQDFPDAKCKFMNGGPLAPHPTGTATVTVTVKKGPDAASLQPDVFRRPKGDDPGRTAPTLTFQWGPDSAHSTCFFEAPFFARKEGVYEFTSVIETQSKGKEKQTKTLIETVTVTPGEEINDKRQAILDIFDAWMPTSINGVAFPKKFGDPANHPNQDILDLAGWSKDSPDWEFEHTTYDGKKETHKGKGEGNKSFAKRQCNDAYQAAALKDGKKVANPYDIVTSCGSVMGVVLRLWGCDFDGDGKMTTREMSIADDYPPNSKKPTQFGAKHYGYWVDAAEAFKKPAGAGDDWKPRYPKPGDCIVLWDDAKNQRAHVCFLVSASEDTWTTAEGGGGTIPDQTASKNNKDVTWKKQDADHPKGIPYILDVTSGKVERVTGWVDLDKVPNPNFNADGSKK